jgi:hypothetical protein
LERRDQLCEIVFKNILWCHAGNIDPDHFKAISYLKVLSDDENFERVPTIYCWVI